jgi:ketosteroid isomerase-like protein
VSSNDTEMRKLCHALLDAIEQGDLAGVDACYAPDMTMWANTSGTAMSREDNLAVLDKGRDMMRRRTYNDRTVNTFDDGFMAQYTVNVVAHDGTERALWTCLVAEVRDGKITKLFDYLDSGKFGRPPKKQETA